MTKAKKPRKSPEEIAAGAPAKRRASKPVDNTRPSRKPKATTDGKPARRPNWAPGEGKAKPKDFTAIPPEEAAHAADPEKGLPADVDLDFVQIGTPGRPSLYHPSFVALARKYYGNGSSHVAFAEALGVTLPTLRSWRLRYPEFAQACEMNIDIANKEVENAVFQSAIGYTFESVKIMTRSIGEGCSVIEQVPTIEHVPPNMAAAKLWLTNRMSNKWRDKVEHAHEIKTARPPIDLEKLNDTEKSTLLLLLEKSEPVSGGDDVA